LSSGDEIPYPHIKGAGVVIPDCSRGVYAPFRLTSREKRELIREIAQKGLKGIDDFLSSERKEGSVHDRLEELRKRMEEELRRVRKDRRAHIDEKIRTLLEREGISGRETADGLLEEDRGPRRTASQDIRGEILASELIGALEGRVKIEDVGEREGPLRKIWNALKRILLRIAASIMGLLRGLWRLLRGKDRTALSGGRSRRKREKGAISLPFPSLNADLDRWERELSRKIEKDRNLQKAVNQKLSETYGYSSGSILLKRSIDPDWYRRKATEVLREEVKRRADLKERELSREREKDEARRWNEEERRRKRMEEVIKLERSFDEEMKETERKLSDIPKIKMKKELISVLSGMGYISRSRVSEGVESAEEEWEITDALIEKFSELIYAELRSGGGIRERRGTQTSNAGVYEKGRIKTVSEECRMDMLQSIVNARMNHPGDRSLETGDMIVLREVTTSEIHGVIVMDISGSMEENSRIEAARRACLALLHAIKRDNPNNRVDIISMSTRAEPVSLKKVMTLEPRGFTNMQQALALSRSILRSSRADKKLLFIITDGLPEAYIDEEGRAFAGDLDVSMELALGEAAPLLSIPDLSFTLFLLEPEDRIFVEAARRIVNAGGGGLIVADPNDLAGKVLSRYEADGKILEGI